VALLVQKEDLHNSTKTIIFPEQSAADDDTDPVMHRMRLLSHGSFAPGKPGASHGQH
jgi:hypothetical protein